MSDCDFSDGTNCTPAEGRFLAELAEGREGAQTAAAARAHLLELGLVRFSPIQGWELTGNGVRVASLLAQQEAAR